MKNNNWNGAICALIAVVLVSGTLAAEEPLVGTDRVLDARAVGLSGSLRASPSSTSGIYLNPATMSMASIYHVNFKYQYTGKDDLHNGGILFLDSVTSARFAAGVSLDYRRAIESHSDFASWDARLAISTGFADKFFIGMTGRYIRVSNDLNSGDRGPNGQPALSSSGSLQANGFTFDTGIAAKLGNVVTLGLVGYNLTATKSVYAPIQLGGGIGVNIKGIFLIEPNVVFDFSSHEKVNEEFTIGTEVFIEQVFSIRAGYSHDVYYQLNRISAGIGYSGSKFAVDFGYGQDISTSIAFGLPSPFDSS